MISLSDKEGRSTGNVFLNDSGGRSKTKTNPEPGASCHQGGNPDDRSA